MVAIHKFHTTTAEVAHRTDVLRWEQPTRGARRAVAVGQVSATKPVKQRGFNHQKSKALQKWYRPL